MLHYSSESQPAKLDLARMRTELSEPNALLTEFLVNELGLPHGAFAKDMVEAGLPYSVLSEATDEVPAQLEGPPQVMSQISKMVTPANLFLICYLCEQHGLDPSTPALLYAL